MTTFSAYAADFEAHPRDGEAFRRLDPLFRKITRVDFELRVDNPVANQGQMESNFDEALERHLCNFGATHTEFPLPREIPQELDFAFSYQGQTVAVEIEKANREKILRDILKCHMYLHAGADIALVVLPKNYPHKHGVWDLFEFGVKRYDECRRYGFGTSDKLGRIVLLGFTQFEAQTGEPLSMQTRERIRRNAAAGRCLG